MEALKVAKVVTIDRPDLNEIRDSMPGQREAIRAHALKIAGGEKLQLAEVEYGLSYTRDAISRRVEKSLPWRFGWERTARWHWISEYGHVIPDSALERYAQAKQAGLFDVFNIVEARYNERAQDPWLVGRVEGTERYIVLAYWD